MTTPAVSYEAIFQCLGQTWPHNSECDCGPCRMIDLIGSDPAEPALPAPKSGRARRVQRRRIRGWRMPPHTVYTGRPSRWGNPFSRAGTPFNRQQKVALYKVALYRVALRAGALAFAVEDLRRELEGKDITDWCRDGDLCHTDVLLEVLNEARSRLTEVASR